jgi:hypothetical protein
MKKLRSRSVFHVRCYRYVRMMLRRYPKMRREKFGLTSNSGVRAICGETFGAALKRQKAKYFDEVE